MSKTWSHGTILRRLSVALASTAFAAAGSAFAGPLGDEAVGYFERRLGDPVVTIEFENIETDPFVTVQPKGRERHRSDRFGYVSLASKTLCRLFVEDEQILAGDPVNGLPFKTMSARCVPVTASPEQHLEAAFIRGVADYQAALTESEPNPVTLKLARLTQFKGVTLDGTPKLQFIDRPLYRVGAGALPRKNLQYFSPTVYVSGEFHAEDQPNCSYAIVAHSYLWELLRRQRHRPMGIDIAKLSQHIADSRSLFDWFVGTPVGPSSVIGCRGQNVLSVDPQFQSILP